MDDDDELSRARDNARTEIMRLTYERDAAVALLNEPVASTEKVPSPVPPSASGAVRLGSVKLPMPVLKPKPDLASRPVVGYSMQSDEVDEEQLDNRPTSRPPKF